MTMELKKIWQERSALVEEQLVKELNEANPLDKTLCESMKYSLMAGGKRLRPVLLMAAADAVGAKGTDYLTTGCAMEMIHTYSLIHDDLPAMDDDDYRRGKLTNHKVYGAGMATLAGDALLTLAFEVMLRQQGVSAEKLVQVVREISTAAGPNGMVGGQALDMESEDKQISMETMKNIHLGKTGALFRAAIRSGAILGGASEEALQALTVYADNFGLAFQITDDILDVIGDEQVIGKPVGSDEKNHKSTYVTLTSLEEAQKLAQEAVDTAIDALKIFGAEADFLRELVAFLVKRNK
ncbi:MAG: polyprenyl synthetase family protein [Selenomonas ruminantium]|jgi:geranylgeranyl diphosphate synthase type II|uniref:Farnesyl diphosphate synthase n=1 Tax=Selenomonas ruminantium TaxID=971 RepID=A0A927WM32_SELRU|nr:polyprenyl synthetase family protein [Selenomonas ruminantium]